MAITKTQIAAAKKVQDAAAHDLNRTVRLIAGPGSGKSFVIEERVSWLIQVKGISPKQIVAVSFTRAATNDLRDRIYKKGLEDGIRDINQVKVSTLHSLALWILKRTDNLKRYPSEPVILDEWEQQNIFDSEFGEQLKINKTQASKIRQDHEAFWSTGNWRSTNTTPIKPIVTDIERKRFNAFYISRTQVYSCVLAGEVISTCVGSIKAGHINPIQTLGVQHIIIDEAQDLNPCDFEFIDSLVTGGANVFISGDDDQSIYSFRYAYPQGIQEFPKKYLGTTDHVLNECFRCTVRILDAAIKVLDNFPDTNRIPKQLISLYSNSEPPNEGVILGKKFENSATELDYIGNSCRALLLAGIAANDIMILVGNKKQLLAPIIKAFQDRNLPFEANRREEFKKSKIGRFILSLLRIKQNTGDYIAHRVLVGTPMRIGVRTVSSITSKIIKNNLDYRKLFYDPLPKEIFNPTETKAIRRAIQNINKIDTWDLGDTLTTRIVDIENIILTNFMQKEVDAWNNYISSLPIGLTLSELKEYMETDSEIKKDAILAAVYERQGLTNQNTENPNPLEKIRILSFHSSKGLSAKIIFIPGLEKDVFPTERTQKAEELILENARLFYVALSRGKGSCILSYSLYRRINGLQKRMQQSRYAMETGITFENALVNQLSDAEIVSIKNSLENL